MKKFLISSIILITFFTLNVQFSFAQQPPPSGTNVTPPSSVDVTSKNNSVFPTLKNPIKANNIQELLNDVVNLAIVIGMIVAVLMFIWIGFKFVMARGNSEALKEARNWFLWAVVGTAILISARVITAVVQNTLTSAGVVDERLFKQ